MELLTAERLSTLELNSLDNQNHVGLKLFVKIPITQKTVLVEAMAHHNVRNIKSLIQVKEGVQSNQFTLVYDGKLLEDDDLTLASLNMKSEANLVVILCPKQLLSIFVKVPTRDILKIEVPALFTVGDVKEIIGSMIVSSFGDHFLSYAGKKLEDSKTLACYEIEDESILEMLPPSVNQIFVKTWSGKTVTLDVQLCNTVKNVKHKLYDKLQISPHLQKIIFAGRQLSDDRNLASYGIQKDSTLFMVLTPKFKIIRLTLADTSLRKLPASTTISSLKDKFQQDSQRRVKEVIFCHETLMGERSLADYGIKRNSEMDFVLEWP